MATSSYDSLSHAKWDCKYHVVFLPQRRKEALDGKSRRFFGPMQPTILLWSSWLYGG
jgi:putative transposase